MRSRAVPWPGHTDGTRYDLTDVQFSVVAVIDEFGALAERVAYDALPARGGRARHRWFSDLDGDGDSDGNDFAVQLAAASTTIHGTNDRPEADHDRDGDVDSVDYFYFLTGASRAALAEGLISDPLGPDSPIGYDGYVFAPEAGLNAPAGGPQAQAIGAYCVRFRWYLPETGRWLQRDPIQRFHTLSSGMPALLGDPLDSTNLFEAFVTSPMVFTDEFGLASSVAHPHGWVLVWIQALEKTRNAQQVARILLSRGVSHTLVTAAGATSIAVIMQRIYQDWESEAEAWANLRISRGAASMLARLGKRWGCSQAQSYKTRMCDGDNGERTRSCQAMLLSPMSRDCDRALDRADQNARCAIARTLLQLMGCASYDTKITTDTLWAVECWVAYRICRERESERCTGVPDPSQVGGQ